MKKTFTYIGLAASLLYTQATFSQCGHPTESRELNVNNVTALLQNGGDGWWDLVGQARYEVPANSGITAFFTKGLWIGGKTTSGQVHFAASKYRQSGSDYFSGPLNDQGTTDASNCVFWDKMFEVKKSEIDAFLGGGTPSNSILEWPGTGNSTLNLPTNIDLAPFVDVNQDGIYDPNDGDYPKIKGDQAIWWIFNDAGNVHTETGADQVGIQVAVMAYAYATNNAVNNATFYDYTITKKNDVSLTDAYVGMFTDFDLGNAQDDFVAFDKTRHLSFALNGDAFDEDNTGGLGYHAKPPKAGIQFVQPVMLNDVEQPLGAHTVFNNNLGIQGTPSSAVDHYLLTQGFWKDGSPITVGGTGNSGTVPTKFMYDISDVDNNWTECTAGNTPGDRRSILSYGPFDLNKDDVIQFTYAAIWARSNDDYNCSNYDDITNAADVVKAFHDSANSVYNSVQTVDPLVNKLYPMPVEDRLNIEFNNEFQGEKEITLYDPMGRMVINEKTTSMKHTLSLNHLPKGIYFLNIKENESLTRTPIILQ